MNAAHPGYISHMDSIPSTACILVDFVALALNNNMLSVEMSPVFFSIGTIVVLKEIACAMFGLPEETAGGCLDYSGGSLGNLQGNGGCTESLFSGHCQKGSGGGYIGTLTKAPVFFTSIAAHSSFEKGSHGIGVRESDAAIGVETNSSNGRLDTEAQPKAIAHAPRVGQALFAIVATAGTTVTVSMDPMVEMAAIVKEHDLWLHVDASYGGALAFGPLKHLFAGTDQADSITFNPQKWLYVAKTCAMTLFRDAALWKHSFRVGAAYMAAGENASFNIGEVSLQGTRHADIF